MNTMKYTTASMNEWLYPDSKVETARHEIHLTAVRGGSAGFQILCNNVTADRITAAYTAAGSAPYRAELFRERSVNVPKNTGVHGFTADWETAKDYATRPAPFRVFDAIEPIPSDGVARLAETEAIYVSFAVDPACPAGRYTGTVTVNDAAVAVELTVANAVQPAETLNFTNWFPLSTYGTKPWSEEHWAILEQLGRQMRRIHQTIFWVHPAGIASVDDAGVYHFDYTNTKRLIELYLSMGFQKIEGQPIFGRDSWDADVFKITTPKGRVLASSDEAYEYVTAMLNAWRAFLKENGWYDRLIQHVGDEPHDKVATEYRVLSGIVRKLLPGVKLLDAVERYELQGAVDIWVPKDDFYARNMDAMERLRSLGDEIWFYTCCIPGGHYANRLLDMPLLRSRMLFWGSYRYHLTGFLHWGLNFGTDTEHAAFEDTCPSNSPTQNLPAGDSHILYPLGKQVLGSMRAEMARCGTEDYELLNALAAADKAKADELCGVVFRAFDDCDNETAVFDDLHDKLVAAFEAVSR